MASSQPKEHDPARQKIFEKVVDSRLDTGYNVSMEITSHISTVLIGISILVLVFAFARFHIMNACIGICCYEVDRESTIFMFSCVLALLLAVLGFAVR